MKGIFQKDTDSLFKNRYRPQSTRLKGYNYSQEGAYFITICTQDRFDILAKSEMVLWALMNWDALLHNVGKRFLCIIKMRFWMRG